MFTVARNGVARQFDHHEITDCCDRLITLDQIAAMVYLKKKSMRRYVKDMPAARRPGRGRREALWSWQDIRPWLAENFGMPKLPVEYPVWK